MRMIDPLWRAAVAVAAVGLAILAVVEDPGVPATVILVAVLLTAGGALANRRWVPMLPLAAAGVWFLWIFVDEGTNLSDTGGETTWALVFVVIGGAALIAAAGLAFGAFLRWAVDSRIADGRRGHRSRGTLATG